MLLGKYAATIDFGGGPMTSAGSFDAFLVEFTGAGALVWQKTMGGIGLDSPMGLALDSSGGPVVAGYFGGSSNFGGGNITSAGSNDVFVARYTATGGFVLAKNYGDTSDQRVYAVAVNEANGNIALTGYIFGSVDFGNGTITNPNTGGGAPIVAELNSTGVGVWSHVFTTNLGYGALGQAVAFDGGGNVVMTGSMVEPLDFGCGIMDGNTYDVVVAKFTAAGACSWSHRYLSDWDDHGKGIAVDPTNSDIVVTGDFAQSDNFGGGVMTTPGGSHGFVAKFTP